MWENHVIAAQKEIESLTSQRFSERDPKRADWKPQIQTHSPTRVSAPLLQHRVGAGIAGSQHGLNRWGMDSL